MTIETTADNAAILQEQVASLLIQPLEERSQFLSAGPVILDGASPHRIPRVVKGINAAWVGEVEEINADANVEFDEVKLLPTERKSLKSILRVSNLLLRSSVVGLDAVLRNRIIRDVSLAIDAALFDGDGADHSITGIFRQPSIVTGEVDLSDIDSLIDAQAAAQENFVSPTHWVMTPASFAKLRKIKVGTDDQRYVINPQDGVQPGTRFQLLGLPVVVTSHIPDVAGKARVALVDMNEVVVARDLDAQVKLLTERYAEFDSLGLRIVSRWDVALQHAKAVTVLTEATTRTVRAK